MTENEQAKQQTEPGQQGPMSKSQADATEELSDEELDEVAGGSWSWGATNA